MTKRIADTNGFVEVRDNPITKTGVFPYSGAQIGAPDKDKIYMVLRPSDELQKPETIESFKLLPFIHEHEMLGDGFTPAERKGVQGVIGSDVHFDEPYLKGTIKIFGENLKGAIRDGKLELSAGYRCKYEFTQGEWNGHHYDAIQRDIRGNHLALVEQGRSGPDVRVMDDMTITFDEKEIFPMNEETMSSDDRIAAIEEKIDKLMAFMEKLKPVEEAEHGQSFDDGEEEYAAPAVAEPAEPTEETDEAEEIKPDVSEVISESEPSDEIKKAAADCGLDSENPEVMKAFSAGMNYGKEDAQDEAPEEEEKAEVMDEAEFIKRIAKRDAMAKKLSQHVGSFACDSMTLQQVAEYGVKKLRLSVPKGSEIVAMDSWLAGREKPAKTVKPVMDGLLSGSKKIDEFYK